MSSFCLYDNLNISKKHLKIKYKISNIKTTENYYSNYQRLIVDKIRWLRELGYSHRKISKFFNDNEMLSYRGKKFSCGLVFEIEKKYKIHLEKNKIEKGKIIEVKVE